MMSRWHWTDWLLFGLCVVAVLSVLIDQFNKIGVPQ
jgi:hypothetical protein